MEPWRLDGIGKHRLAPQRPASMVTMCAWIFPSTGPRPNRPLGDGFRRDIRCFAESRGIAGLDLVLSGVPWQYAIAGSRADFARLRAATVSMRKMRSWEPAAFQIACDVAAVVAMGRTGHGAADRSGTPIRARSSRYARARCPRSDPTLKMKMPPGLSTRRASEKALALSGRT